MDKENVLENVVEGAAEIIEKKSIFAVLLTIFKKVLFFIFGFKWFYLLSRRSYRKVRKAKDMTIVEIFSLVWFGIRNILLGLFGGYLLYYFDMYAKIETFFIDLFNSIL